MEPMHPTGNRRDEPIRRNGYTEPAAYLTTLLKGYVELSRWGNASGQELRPHFVYRSTAW